MHNQKKKLIFILNFKASYLFNSKPVLVPLFLYKKRQVPHTVTLTAASQQYVRTKTGEANNRRCISHVHKLSVSCDAAFPADPRKSTWLDIWVTHLTSHIVLNVCLCACVCVCTKCTGVKKRCVGGHIFIFIVYYANATQCLLCSHFFFFPPAASTDMCVGGVEPL